MKGYIYILVHPRMQGLVKIGLTTTSVRERVQGINGATGVPEKFKVLRFFEVSDVYKAEKKIHKKLTKFRLLSNKEFFELKPEVAVEYVEAIIKNEEFGVNLDEADMIACNDSSQLAALIKSHRRALGFTQKDVASLIGSGERFVVDVEKGKSTAQIGKVLKLMNVLGVKFCVSS